mmetsp:Transcript_33326/g.87723  ORF Transcript_33326/g.87723 Transcript_33326/m.87723 type:complete len:225 (+) Transcript_33326:1350-2024(+)
MRCHAAADRVDAHAACLKVQFTPWRALGGQYPRTHTRNALTSAGASVPAILPIPHASFSMYSAGLARTFHISQRAPCSQHTVQMCCATGKAMHSHSGLLLQVERKQIACETSRSRFSGPRVKHKLRLRNFETLWTGVGTLLTRLDCGLVTAPLTRAHTGAKAKESQSATRPKSGASILRTVLSCLHAGSTRHSTASLSALASARTPNPIIKFSKITTRSGQGGQ